MDITTLSKVVEVLGVFSRLVDSTSNQLCIDFDILLQAEEVGFVYQKYIDLNTDMSELVDLINRFHKFIKLNGKKITIIRFRFDFLVID